MRSLILCSALLASVSVCLGANPPVPFLVGAGFSNPFPIPVAPGQLLTLFVQPRPDISSPSTSLPSISRGILEWIGRSDARPTSRPGKHRLSMPPARGICPERAGGDGSGSVWHPVIAPICASACSVGGPLASAVFRERT